MAKTGSVLSMRFVFLAHSAAWTVRQITVALGFYSAS
jgi:hypothetical protein